MNLYNNFINDKCREIIIDKMKNLKYQLFSLLSVP